MPPQNHYEPTLPPGPTPAGEGQPQNPENYEFIVNPTIPPKKGPKFGVASKLVYVLVGGVVLVIFMSAFALLGSSKKVEPALVTVAQDQTEIARVAGSQLDNLTDDDTKAFALNTQYSMQTAQSDYLSFMSEHGSGISSKSLGSAQNPQTDAALAAAKDAGSLDSTLSETLRTELTQYQQTIKTAYGQTHTDLTHQELQALYDQAGLLIQQSKQQ